MQALRTSSIRGTPLPPRSQAIFQRFGGKTFPCRKATIPALRTLNPLYLFRANRECIADAEAAGGAISGGFRLRRKFSGDNNAFPVRRMRGVHTAGVRPKNAIAMHELKSARAAHACLQAILQDSAAKHSRADKLIFRSFTRSQSALSFGENRGYLADSEAAAAAVSGDFRSRWKFSGGTNAFPISRIQDIYTAGSRQKNAIATCELYSGRTTHAPFAGDFAKTRRLNVPVSASYTSGFTCSQSALSFGANRRCGSGSLRSIGCLSIAPEVFRLHQRISRKPDAGYPYCGTAPKERNRYARAHSDRAAHAPFAGDFARFGGKTFPCRQVALPALHIGTFRMPNFIIIFY